MTEIAETVEQLHERFKAAREAGRGAEVRAAAAAYYRKRREAGATQEVVAGELGLKKWTLAKWCQQRSPGAKRAATPLGASPSAETSEECAALKREVEAAGPQSPGRRLPEELKQRITQWTRRALEEGLATLKIAEMIGISWKSLARWLGGRAPTRKTPAKKLRVVSVLERRPSVAPASAVLRSPSGYVVEGLDVTTLVELLRQLG